MAGKILAFALELQLGVLGGSADGDERGKNTFLSQAEVPRPRAEGGGGGEGIGGAPRRRGRPRANNLS